MLHVLSMCNNNNNSISRLLRVIILFVFVALVATSNAKSAEALDFDAAFAAEELRHSLRYERGMCNSNTTSISGATKQACITDETIAEEGEEEWHTTRAMTKIVSRRKRFLAFPLGSSFSCAVCLTTGVVGNPNYQYLSLGLNWGLAYDLPNATWVLEHAHALGRRKNDKDMQKVEEPTIKRRHRRELYHKVETIMNKGSTAGMSNDDDQAELAFFAHKPMRDNVEAGGNNNFSTRNIRFALTANENSNNYPSDQQIAAARPSDMIGVMMTMTVTDNCSRFTNSSRVMPTINESVDNFRNDKEQIASAAVVEQNNMKAVTGVLVTTARTVAATTMPAKEPATTTAAKVTAVARQSAIKAKVITAIKSAATQFTTLTAAAAAATREAALASTAVTTTTTTPTLPAVRTHITSAGPAPIRSTSKASITMPKLPITTTTRATPWWPTLHGHDLLSSTNGMPNCRVTSVMVACVEKCQATTNNNATTPTTATSMAFVKPSEAIKSSTTAPATAASSPSSSLPSSPATSALTTKVQAPTTATEAKAKATTTARIQIATTKSNQQSWSTTHVTSAGGVKLSPSTNEHNTMTFKAYSNKTKFATTTPKPAKSPSKHQASRLFPVRAAPVESTAPTRPTNLTSALATTTTTTTPTKILKTSTKNAIAKSTSALQLHWQRILTRRKRYLAFPEGASFSVSMCITVGIIGNPRYNYMSYGLNWGVSYDLPNATWVLNQLHGLTRRPTPMSVVHRRSKRALYERIGEAVQNMGYNGRDCVLRALCESRQYFMRNKMGMIGEMLRVVFSLPKQRLFTRELRENSEIEVYDHAYRKARSVDCATHYDCPFSLLELAFGRYAKPPTDYYEKNGM